ncbi:hypothetical protein XELAEV_18036581mg [Xenopus laevis]|uniref:UPAR/Ly6 domain-containing protein n=1 Tax=Xenopus laevis TaxID=8355 RepID=A0A974CIN0_XENLA|nr:hypothetical protein XELAEV_18036581mg [Xenopus laevis]
MSLFFTVPENANQPNQVTCPACLSLDSNLCNTSQSIPCTGSENMCYLGVATSPVFSYPVVLRGCATKSSCDIVSTDQEAILNTLQINSNLLCTNGACHHHYGFLLPAAIASALMKFMFV